MDRRWSVWLIPSRKDRSKYEQIIGLYSKKYLFPKFRSHLTLFGRVDIEPELTFPFFDILLKDQNDIRLETLNVSTGDQPWKSLYIQFKPNILLKALQSKINDKLKIHRDYNFEPHMSLAYGSLDEEELEIDELSLDETIGFSSVALIHTSDDIEDWKLIKKYKLRSKHV